MQVDMNVNCPRCDNPVESIVESVHLDGQTFHDIDGFTLIEWTCKCSCSTCMLPFTLRRYEIDEYVIKSTAGG